MEIGEELHFFEIEKKTGAYGLCSPPPAGCADSDPRQPIVPVERLAEHTSPQAMSCVPRTENGAGLRNARPDAAFRDTGLRPSLRGEARRPQRGTGI